jgi:tRNA (guanosine-2'-O-)-methyltransferase
MRRIDEDVVEGARLAGPKIPWPAGWTAEQVIARLEPFVRPERSARLSGVIGARVSSVTVLMDAPHDPHNAAAVLRTCDAFGLPELHVIPRVEELLVGRSVSKGTERWVDIVVHDSVATAVAALSAQAFTLVATHPEGRLLPEDLTQLPRVALVLGNERDGLCDELRAAASDSVRVPMRGFVESLNVSVAAAVLLAAATQGRPGDLAQADRNLLYARGLFHSVPRARDILAASLSGTG